MYNLETAINGIIVEFEEYENYLSVCEEYGHEWEYEEDEEVYVCAVCQACTKELYDY